MLYFLVTSVYHIVITLYIIKTKYIGDGRRKKLLLLDHVDNLVKLEPALKKCSFLDETAFIHTDKQERQVIDAQLKQFHFTSADVFHLFGWEYCGMSLAKKCKKTSKVILVEEGLYALCDLQKSIDDFHRLQEGCQIDAGLFSEIWKTADAETLIDENERCVDLQMDVRLKNKAFRSEFSKDLAAIFQLKEKALLTCDAVLFDSYYWHVEAGMPEDEEELFLQETLNCLGNADVIIKPHPGERNYLKYDSLGCRIVKQPEVPYEVYSFMDKGKKQILLSSVPTGALTHKQFLFPDNNTVIIYLYQIYRHYHIPMNALSRIAYIEQGAQDGAVGQVFFPHTFAELKKIVREINGQFMGEEEYREEETKETERMLSWYAGKYKEAAGCLPNVINLTTLQGLDNGVFKNLDEAAMKADGTHRFKFEFRVKEQGIRTFRWYLARRVKVDIKEVKITAVCAGLEHTLADTALSYLDSACGTDGFVSFYRVDPCVDFSVDMDCDAVRIEAVMRFDKTYDHFVDTLYGLAENIESQWMLERGQLHREIEKRDEILIEERKKLHREIDNRDVLLKEVIGQREQLQSSLSDEISKYEALKQTCDQSILWKLEQRVKRYFREGTS